MTVAATPSTVAVELLALGVAFGAFLALALGGNVGGLAPAAFASGLCILGFPRLLSFALATLQCSDVHGVWILPSTSRLQEAKETVAHVLVGNLRAARVAHNLKKISPMIFAGCLDQRRNLHVVVESHAAHALVLVYGRLPLKDAISNAVVAASQVGMQR